jgi:hypothetical protein|tara:strand:+ start:893 stop:1114 length:222 start_codon:yes stop_codon:yes gene_type:complete
MTEVLWILVGVLIGAPIGWIGCTALTVSKVSDLDSEIQDLRTQRRLLKEELLKDQRHAKPKPRKKRFNRTKRK